MSILVLNNLTQGYLKGKTMMYAVSLLVYNHLTQGSIKGRYEVCSVTFPINNILYTKADLRFPKAKALRSIWHPLKI